MYSIMKHEVWVFHMSGQRQQQLECSKHRVTRTLTRVLAVELSDIPGATDVCDDALNSPQFKKSSTQGENFLTSDMLAHLSMVISTPAKRLSPRVRGISLACTLLFKSMICYQIQTTQREKKDLHVIDQFVCLQHQIHVQAIA